MTDTRPCTCAPDERPYPCQHQYALGLCRKAEIRSLCIELGRCIDQIVDLTKIRLEDERIRSNVMGRIAIALFGEQNNRGDEDCVAKAIEVVRERNSLRQHLHDEHQRHVGTMDERDAALADLAAAQKTLNDHLLSEAAETMRADKATSELAAVRALPTTMANGYTAGTVTGRELHSVHLHYSTRQQAVAAFNAITDVIDAALAGEKK